MYATVMHGPRDVRYEQVEESEDPEADRRHHSAVRHLHLRVGPVALSRAAAAGRSGAYGPRILRRGGRGRHREVERQAGPVRRRLFVLSDNTCPHCSSAIQSSCEQREFMSGAQAPYARVRWPTARWSRRRPCRTRRRSRSLLAVSDVSAPAGTRPTRRGVKPGSTVVVVGDGAVGLMACSPRNRWARNGSSR